MRISFIGAGRVAHHLAHALKQQHQIIHIYSQGYVHAQKLANEVNAEAVDTLAALGTDIDVLIIAVSDSAISSVIQAVHAHMPNTLIVHTSGSTDVAVLAQIHARAGVLYPLQTFSLDRQIDWRATPIFVEATVDEDLSLLTELATQLSHRVYQYSSEQRLSLHLAAVYACNFSNYCYDMAQQIVDAKQVDFSLLYPLIMETAQKAIQAEPRKMQTGPAMRADKNIIAMHEQMLAQDQRLDLQAVYTLLSGQILKRHQSE